MKLNYRAGLLRVYIVLAILWIAWGTYKPIAGWKKSIIQLHELDVEEAAVCKRQNDAYLALEAAGDAPSQKMADCEWVRQNSERLDSEFEHKPVGAIYRDAGVLKTAEFCLLPPTGVLIGAIVVLWVAHGFRKTAPQSATTHL
jgi:hypothetical protein